MKRHLPFALAIATAWLIFSFVLTLMLAGAEDNDLDMNAPVPQTLKIVCAVVFFPMCYVDNWNQPPVGFSDRAFAILGLFEMFVNGLFWAFMIIFLYRLMARIFANKSVK
jgi:hypothetical protein